jgi:phenylpropionate dioxygenase-like ring-hydroxylating dioxygenase large terminal subunit
MDALLRSLEPFWFPVLPSANLKDTPIAVTVLGRSVVLWRDRDGHPAALENRCRHRSAALSDGHVDGAGHLHCPYHGWIFAEDGRCLQIPQQPDLPLSQRFNVPAYRCAEHCGQIWISLHNSPRLPLPQFARADDQQFRLIQGFYEVWNCSPFRVIENGLDNFHHHFVHQGILNAPSPIPEPIEGPITTTADGLEFRIPLSLHNTSTLEATIDSGMERLKVQRTVRWIAPLGLTLDLDWPNGKKQTIALFATPKDASSCTILRFYWRNDSEADIKADDVIAFERELIDQDRYILEAMPKGLDPWPAEELLIEADQPIAKMRQLLQKFLQTSS